MQITITTLLAIMAATASLAAPVPAPQHKPSKPEPSKPQSGKIVSGKGPVPKTPSGPSPSKHHRRDFENFELFEARAVPPRMPSSSTVTRPTGVKGKGKRYVEEVVQLEARASNPAGGARPSSGGKVNPSSKVINPKDASSNANSNKAHGTKGKRGLEDVEQFEARALTPAGGARPSSGGKVNPSSAKVINPKDASSNANSSKAHGGKGKRGVQDFEQFEARALTPAGGARPSSGGKVNPSSTKVINPKDASSNANSSKAHGNKGKRGLEDIEQFEARALTPAGGARPSSGGKVNPSSAKVINPKDTAGSANSNKAAHGKKGKRGVEDLEQFEARALPPRVSPPSAVNRPTGLKGKGKRDYMEIEELD